MSLRKINRERDKKHKFSIGSKSHFSKLKKGSHNQAPAPESNESDGYIHPKKVYVEGEGLSQNLKMILVIAIIAVAVVGIELILWAGDQDAGPNTQSNLNSTDNSSSNDTPLVNLTLLESEDDYVAPKADLLASSIELSPEELSEGEVVSITAEFENNGELDAENVSLNIYAGGTEIYSEIVTIRSGEKTEIETSWISEGEGSKTIKAEADPGDNIDESDEGNNEKSDSISIEKSIFLDSSDEFTYRGRILELGDIYAIKKLISNDNDAYCGEDMNIFSLSKKDSHHYYLDVHTSIYRKTNYAGNEALLLADGSCNWNGGSNIISGTAGHVFNGPLMGLGLGFEGSKLVVKDQNGKEASVSSGDSAVKSITPIGIKIADWPEDELNLYTTSKANGLFPEEFYIIEGGRRIYLYPLAWNPATKEAKVAVGYQFEITTG